jgi:hypothetical protein
MLPRIRCRFPETAEWGDEWVCHALEATEREGGNSEMVPVREQAFSDVETVGAGVTGSVGGEQQAAVEYVDHLLRCDRSLMLMEATAPGHPFTLLAREEDEERRGEERKGEASRGGDGFRSTGSTHAL